MSTIWGPAKANGFTFLFFFQDGFTITSRCTVLIASPSIILYAIFSNLMLYNSRIFLIFDSFLVIFIIHPIDIVIFCKIYSAGIWIKNCPIWFRFFFCGIANFSQLFG